MSEAQSVFIVNSDELEEFINSLIAKYIPPPEVLLDTSKQQMTPVFTEFFVAKKKIESLEDRIVYLEQKIQAANKALEAASFEASGLAERNQL